MSIAKHGMQIAKTLHKEKNEELLELSVKSTDFHHRIAAAWAYGLDKNHNDCLFVLMTDRHPLVCQAAREACVSIAKLKYKDMHADFGPVLNANQAMKEDSMNLWQSYFEKKAKKKLESKPAEKEEAPKSVQEVLGIKE